jgi:hypothetical protein
MAHTLQISMAALHEHVLHVLQRNDLAAASLTDVEAARNSPSSTA